MQARLLKNNKTAGRDMLVVRIDDHSLRYLQQGLPLRAAFFTDKDDHLPWYQRKSMVVYIGKNLDLDEHERQFNEKEPHQAIIDHNYLIHSIHDVRNQLITVLRNELLKLGVFPENLNRPPAIENGPAPVVPIEIKPEINAQDDNTDRVSLEEAVTILKISKKQVLFLAKKGLLNGLKDEHGFGWEFDKKELVSVSKIKPNFLQKAWKRKMLHDSHKIIFVNKKKYIRLAEAQSLLKLTRPPLLRYIKSGQLLTIRKGRSHYIHKSYLDDLVAKPPAWLTKAWSYFNNPNNTRNDQQNS